MSKHIYIGSDHGGFELKEALKKQLSEIQWEDVGCFENNRCDYPNIADALVKSIQNHKEALGILICGTGIGISMRANRYKGIRAALVYDVETARLAKAHNQANVLCLGGRTTDIKTAISCVKTWLITDYDGGRHDARIFLLDS